MPQLRGKNRAREDHIEVQKDSSEEEKYVDPIDYWRGSVLQNPGDLSTLTLSEESKPARRWGRKWVLQDGSNGDLPMKLRYKIIGKDESRQIEKL